MSKVSQVKVEFQLCMTKVHFYLATNLETALKSLKFLLVLSLHNPLRDFLYLLGKETLLGTIFPNYRLCQFFPL